MTRFPSDMDLREAAYAMGFEDATDGLPEDVDPTTVSGETPAVADYFTCWDGYVAGYVDAGGEMPF
jgi:hypothetical protein